MKTLIEVYVTQAKIFWRDRTALIITLILPVVLAAFFSMIFSKADDAKIRLIIVNNDNEAISRAIVKELLEGDYSGRLEVEKTSQGNAMEALRKGEADVVAVLPDGTSRAIARNELKKVTVFYDPNRAKSIGIGVQVVRSMLAEINMGIAEVKPTLAIRPISSLPKKKSLAEFYLPNFLALSVLWLGLFATAVPIVQQRQNKIFLRMGATPLSPTQLMLGLTAWRLTLGIIQTTLFLGVGMATLHIPVPDNLLLLLLAVIVGNLTFVAMGYMISAISSTVESAGSITQVFNFPMMFLSGIFFTSDMLPAVVNKVSFVIPLTYLADLYRQIIVGYPGIVSMGASFTALAGFGLLCSVIAVRFWRWD
ncbi:MAG: ABC transporter permease [Actinomycetota bacterium]|nr:ABC transporter permease [Actinomycetota bacterium]